MSLPNATQAEGSANSIPKTNEANAAADASAQEGKIDGRVYRLYGLTPEEIKIVEEASA